MSVSSSLPFFDFYLFSSIFLIQPPCKSKKRQTAVEPSNFTAIRSHPCTYSYPPLREKSHQASRRLNSPNRSPSVAKFVQPHSVGEATMHKRIVGPWIDLNTIPTIETIDATLRNAHILNFFFPQPECPPSSAAVGCSWGGKFLRLGPGQTQTRPLRRLLSFPFQLAVARTLAGLT